MIWKYTYYYRDLFRLGPHHRRQSPDLSLVTVKNKGHKRSSHYYNDDGHSISSAANMNVTQITASFAKFTYLLRMLRMLMITIEWQLEVFQSWQTASHFSWCRDWHDISYGSHNL